MNELECALYCKTYLENTCKFCSRNCSKNNTDMFEPYPNCKICESDNVKFDHFPNGVVCGDCGADFEI